MIEMKKPADRIFAQSPRYPARIERTVSPVLKSLCLQIFPENLKAERFEDGAHGSFDPSRITRALREYAIGGFLHFDHLAALPGSLEYPLLRRRAGSELARSLREPYDRIA